VGDEAYTLSELAAEISLQMGRTIPYRDLLSLDRPAVDDAAPVGAVLDTSQRAAHVGQQL
jgi:hypothetical protein